MLPPCICLCVCICGLLGKTGAPVSFLGTGNFMVQPDATFSVSLKRFMKRHCIVLLLGTWVEAQSSDLRECYRNKSLKCNLPS